MDHWGWDQKRKAPSQSLSSRPVRRLKTKTENKVGSVLKNNSLWLLASYSFSLSLSHRNLQTLS